MRKILFRGKRLDTGEWIEGWYYKKPNTQSSDGEPVKHYISDLPPFGAEVKPETVGEYSGLTDKNGKPIFEGDIVAYHKPVVPWWDRSLPDGTTGEVVFSAGAFYMSVERNALVSAMYLLNSFFGAHGSILEVVSNVHDGIDYCRTCAYQMNDCIPEHDPCDDCDGTEQNHRWYSKKHPADAKEDQV